MNSSNFTAIKSVDMCDSQLLQQYPGGSNIYSQKTYKFPDVSTPMNVLLQKIQAINNKKQQKTIIFQQNKDKIHTITRQGRNEDQPHKPNVLNTSLSKKSKNKSQRNSSVNSKYKQAQIKAISINKEKEPNVIDSKFYKYCTDQIVRLSTQNSNLQKNLQKTLQSLQTQRKTVQLLTSEKKTLLESLKKQTQLKQRKDKQFENLKTKLSEQKQKNLQNQKVGVYNLSEKTKIYEQQLSKYRKIIQQKQEKNNQLANQLKNSKIEGLKQMELAEQNRKISRKLGQIMIQNKRLHERCGAKSQAVDHLWSIKQIEYSNIVQLIAKSKQKLGRQQ